MLFQPLTELSNKKCKRCGFYEKDTIKSDDIFDEWEFCPSDFTAKGKYSRLKDKEVNATFSCPQCIPFVSCELIAYSFYTIALCSDGYPNLQPNLTPILFAAPSSSSDSHKGGKGMHVAVIILISVLVSTVFILGLIVAFKYWQKKKREQDQARFLKLFEEGDDIEDELGLGNVL